MSSAPHLVIIGNGVAGNRAAEILREKDKDCRISIISAGALLFYNRYELPDVFKGRQDWRDYLENPPEYFADNNITLRRKSIVADVNTDRRTLLLDHREEIGFDQLLVATGGAGYLPERLQETANLTHQFTTYRGAMKMYHDLPKGGRVVMLGGDMIGLDLARTLIETGYHVTVVPGDRTFWPHEISAADRPKYLAALETMGIEVIDHGEAERIEDTTGSASARRVVFVNGESLAADVVLTQYGLAPMVDFMSTAGVDIERGLLVNPQLRTTRDEIWAAGDVCQIWQSETNSYRFYYGWRNVRQMGEIAARNMMGEDVPFSTDVDEQLVITKDGGIDSPFWEYSA
jgi:NAD(P)H-nitrite reductase large subunit